MLYRTLLPLCPSDSFSLFRIESPGEKGGREDEGEGCLGNDRGFLDVVAGATCNQRPLNMRQKPERGEEGLEKSEKGRHLISS